MGGVQAVSMKAAVAAVAISAAERAKRSRTPELLKVAAMTGLPEAQRDPEVIALVKVPQIDDGPRVADKTVRRLTRVERLRRSGVLDPHEAAAAEWFADTHALAWDTTGCTANYEGRDGGGSAHAPDGLMAKNEGIARARDDYRTAIHGVPAAWLLVFERVVCRNDAIGATAATEFATLQRSAGEGRVRLILKTVAGKIGERMGHVIALYLPPKLKAERATCGTRVASRVAAVVDSAPKGELSLIAAIDARIDQDDEAGHRICQLLVSESVHDAMLAELGQGPTKRIEIYRGLDVVVRDGWAWAWMTSGVAEEPDDGEVNDVA